MESIIKVDKVIKNLVRILLLTMFLETYQRQSLCRR